MFDLKEIRDNPDAFDANWARRGVSPQSAAILALDAQRRDVQTRLQEVQQQRNEKSKQIGQLKAQGGDAEALMSEVSGLKDEMALMEAEETRLGAELEALLSGLPNRLSDDVPDGADENENVEVRKIGDIKQPTSPEHNEIGEQLGLMDFELAAKLSGSRFVWMQGDLARLERALAQFMLDTHVNEHGYTEVSPPILVRDHVLYGTGQLPKFEDDQFKTTRGDYLIPTAEVVLTNRVRDAIMAEEELPLRLTAFTPCFRQEAGAAGKDTRGMIRQHQFYKVEMVSITTPERSAEEHERMTDCAETILKKLDLPFRTIVLCSGDTGFGAMKTYDLEVWLPGQGAYREISSCSNCGDFQARRMRARCRPAGEKQTRFVHTLNGSGVAVGRALIAVMENYWDESAQCIHVPDVLKPYMGGVEQITKSGQTIRDSNLTSLRA